MTTIQSTTLAALAHVVAAVRHEAISTRKPGAREWEPRGIVRQLEAVANRSLIDVTTAAIRAAADRLDQDTPAIISAGGSHWAGTATARTPAADICPHHRVPVPCRECAEYARKVVTDRERIRAIRRGAVDG